MSIQFNRSFWAINHPFYAVEGGGGGEGNPQNEGMSKEDMIEFLGDEEEPEVIDLKGEKPPVKVKGEKEIKPEGEVEEEIKPEGEEEEELDELKELEDELEEPTDEQLELMTPVRRQEILKKYPQLFKDFPYLERAYYREQQYTELFPTIDDAKKAVTASQTLGRFEKELMGGDTVNILKAVASENKDAFYKIVDNYMGTLANVDEKAYNHVIGNVIKHTIATMVREAGSSKNEKLQEAAHLLNQFVFGSSEWTPPTTLSRNKGQEENTEEQKLSRDRQKYQEERFTDTRQTLNSRIENVLKSTIEANIDPKQSMTDYVRKTASREARETLLNLIERDTRFKTLMDRLWEKVFTGNFQREDVDRIRRAYISKARTLLPSVIKKARNDALRGLGKRVKDEEEEVVEQPSERQAGNRSGQPPAPRKGGKINSAKDIPAGMSTLEFLNQD